MPETAKSRAAALPHLRRSGFAMGDSIPLPLTVAAIFHAPGDATGFNQFGRFSNPPWDPV
ncbi:cystathionine gamma-lyase, partial [Mesorhizobium sp. M3A.F.Ca.ET.201.01.1.1]